MGRDRILTEKQIEWACEKHRNGYSTKEIGAALFVHYSTVRSALKGRDCKRPPLVYDFSKEVE